MTPASQLRRLASQISEARINALISKYYNTILLAKYERRFSTTFILDSDEFGIVAEELDAIEAIGHYFPGIQRSYDVLNSQQTVTFRTPS